MLQQVSQQNRKVAKVHEAREISCDPIKVAEHLRPMLNGYLWSRDTVGESGCAVYKLDGNRNYPDLYLKHGRGDFARDVIEEADRLHWLKGRAPVSHIAGFAALKDEAWLVTTAVVGYTAYQLLERDSQFHGEIVDALASFLHRFHQIPTTDCPFDSGLELRLDLARQRLEAGLVDSDDFDKERTGLSPQQVWDRMMSLLPVADDLVVTHGDFSLDNIIFDQGKLAACIDTGRVGVADRYQDIAIMWNCLEEFGETLQQQFRLSYGITDLDQQKLQVHLILDEFF
jgi:aminoglycoside 3'-phosphotransferase I